MTYEEIEQGLMTGALDYHRLTKDELETYKSGTMTKVNTHFDRLSNDPEYAMRYHDLYLRVMYPCYQKDRTS